ncbi:MAG: 4'-phosphopantetheinyl transferase superfamily protein [Chthoniobacterales bacterium]
MERDEIVIAVGGLEVFAGTPLSFGERERAASMSSEEARLRFTAARRLLRSVVSRWCPISASELEIFQDEHGKPRLVTPDPIQFSITHSSGCIAVAFSRSEVGLDLECVREVDATALARRFFSAEEAIACESSADHELFFRLWTCREAAIKGDGRGLSNLLGVTRVASWNRGTGDPMEILIGEESWHAISWKVDAETHAAVAFRKKPSLISWCDLR